MTEAARHNQRATMVWHSNSGRMTTRFGSAAPRVSGFVLGFAAALAFGVAAPAATFTASLDRDTLILGETAVLALTYEDCQPQRVPALPNIANLQFTYHGPSQQTSVINGLQRSTITLQFTVTPQQPGSYTIPALRGEVEGQALASAALSLKVLREDTSGPPAAMANQPAFFWPVLPKRELYLQEVFVAEFRVYIHGSVRQFSIQASPLAGDGFTASKLIEGQHYQRRVGNTPYTVVPLLVAITPVKTGKLTLEPLTGNVVVNPRDPWDIDSFFFRRAAPQQLPISLERQQLTVLALPRETVPPGFNGAVGSYTTTFSAGPTNVAVGDPITVKVRIAGRGALDALTLPEQAAWKNFKTYPTTSLVETSDPLGLQGAKSFEQVIVPQSADITELPALEFSFFDPDQKAYRTLKQPAVPLAVRPGSATPAPVIAAGKTATQEAPPPAQDIVGIKQHLGTVALLQAPLALRPSFWALNTIPLLGWLAALAWRKRADSLANNPRLRRRKQVAQIVNDGLEELRKLASANKSADFFATLFRLLQEQIGERLDLPASAITEAIVDERLKPAGLSDAACASLHELFQTCNLARYAPVQSRQELAALVPRLEAVILQLRRIEV